MIWCVSDATKLFEEVVEIRGDSTLSKSMKKQRDLVTESLFTPRTTHL